MHCFICNVNCKLNIRQCLTIETSETVATKTKYETIIARFIESGSLKIELKIKSTDIICQTCSTILENYDELMTVAIINQELLLRQIYRNINVKYECQIENLLRKFDNRARELFAINTNNQYLCKKCEFKTQYEDTIGAHYRYHIIRKHISDSNEFNDYLNGNDNVEDINDKVNHNQSSAKVPYNNTSDTVYIKEETGLSDPINCNLQTSWQMYNINHVIEDDFLTEQIPINIMNDTKIKKCKICYKIFFQQSELLEHYKSHRLKYKCVHCDVVSYSKTNVTDHINNVHLAVCQQCGAHCFDSIACDHSDAKKFQYESHTCLVCQEVFFKSSLLRQHAKKTHATCTICGQYFANRYQLREHRRKVHDNTESEIKCEICNKRCASKRCLRLHVAAVHTKNYKYECKLCNKKFMDLLRLNEHRTVHTKETLYICEKCGLKFRHSASYTTHKKLHENPRPFNCDSCDKPFATKSHLALHRRLTHIKDRKHKCTYKDCNESYITAWQLRRHLTKHTGIYIYNCKLCPKGYNTKNDYANHLSKKHNDDSLLHVKREYKIVLPPEH